MYRFHFRETSRFALILTVAAGYAVLPALAAEQPKFYRPAKTPTVIKVASEQPKPKDSRPSDIAVVNSASFLEGVSPGAVATIFGADITGSAPGTFIGTTDPLPLELNGISVYVTGTLGGAPAPLFNVVYSADGTTNQISFQVPYGAPVGLQSVEVQVTVAGQVVTDVLTDSFTEDPGIFTYFAADNLDYPVVLRYPNYDLIGPDNEANPGDVLILYTTGLGPLTLMLQDGSGAPSTPPFAETTDPFLAVLNGENCDVLFSGLAPGFVGLDQINMVVPMDAAQGQLALQITSSDASMSNITYLPVQ